MSKRKALSSWRAVEKKYSNIRYSYKHVLYIIARIFGRPRHIYDLLLHHLFSCGHHYCTPPARIPRSNGWYGFIYFWVFKKTKNKNKFMLTLMSFLGNLLVFFVQYFETFLFEFSFYTVFPCLILFRSRVDYYQIWSARQDIKVNYDKLSLIHIWRCRRYSLCRSRWSPYH